jgi:hypothetical protein
MAAIPGDQPVLTNFTSKLLFKKTLTQDDLRRIYLPRSDVSKLCPAAFDNESHDPIELVFYDPSMTRSYNAHFTPKTTPNNGIAGWRLNGDWSLFAKKFPVGQEIYFAEYKCNRGTGARHIVVGSVLLMGVLIG